MRIGVGITTRNRSKILDLMLLHHMKFFPKDGEVFYFILDDNSDENYVPVIAKYQFCFYKKSDTRLGIAKAKNECIKYLHNCDYVFLFDDDACPMHEDWYKVYIEASNCTGVGHFQHMIQIAGLNKISSQDGLDIFDNTGGVMLFFTREMLNKVGGFDPKFGIYGYEHSNLTSRCFNAGGNKYGQNLTPGRTGEVIYSLDFNLNHLGQLPPLGKLSEEGFTSSLRGEESNIQTYINSNRGIGSGAIRVEI